jgi:hypothetical protein
MIYIKNVPNYYFFNYTFWGPPFANFGAPFNWGPGVNCLFCPLPPSGGPDWQSKARNNVFYEQRTSKNLLLIKH